MADTLRSLAGARFKVADVIAALHPPLEPEQLVLDRYVFLPHARAGIAAPDPTLADRAQQAHRQGPHRCRTDVQRTQMRAIRLHPNALLRAGALPRLRVDLAVIAYGLHRAAS